MFIRESDMPIVVMKQGNSCGAKGHVLLCRGLRKYSPVAELDDRSGNRIKFPIKGCRRVPFVSSSKEPDEGNPQVRFCEGGKAVMLWRSLNKVAYPSTRRAPG